MIELTYVAGILRIHANPMVVRHARRALVSCPPIKRYGSRSTTVNSSGRLVRSQDPMMGSPEDCWRSLARKKLTCLYNYPVAGNVVQVL